VLDSRKGPKGRMIMCFSFIRRYFGLSFHSQPKGTSIPCHGAAIGWHLSPEAPALRAVLIDLKAMKYALYMCA